MRGARGVVEALRQRLEATVREREQAEARLAAAEAALGPAAVDAPKRAAALEREVVEIEVSLRRLRAAEAELRERLAAAERAEARERLEREVAEAQAAVEAIARRIREEYPRLAVELAGLARAEREARDLIARAAMRVQQAEITGLVAPGEVVAAIREPVDLYRSPDHAHGARLALCDGLVLPNVLDPSGRSYW